MIQFPWNSDVEKNHPFPNDIDMVRKLCKYYELESISTAEDLISNMQLIFDKLGVPRKLSQFNIFKTDKDLLVSRMQTQQIGFDQNPLPFSSKADFPLFIDNFLE